jgi:hypothetical protein
MKKYICMLLALLLLITACTGVDPNKPIEQKPVDHEIFPKEVMKMLNIIKHFKAATTVDVGGETFIIISFGQKQGSGYGAKITEVIKEDNKITFVATPGVAKDPSAEIISFDYVVEVIKKEEEQIEIEIENDYMPKVIGLKNSNYELITKGDNIGILDFSYEPGAIHISGIASIWEACFFYELRDVKGRVLKESTVMAEAGAPDWGFFNLDLEFSKNVSSLVFLEENAKTGEHNELLRLDLKYEK